MNKVIVIGCPGSGKTTFAEKLNKLTGLPLFYLDAIWHKADKTHISREEFDNKLKEIDKLDKWIIDGNYSRTIETRIKMCDTVILFDLPTEICLMGATERIGKQRNDMPWIDTELDPAFEREILLTEKTSYAILLGNNKLIHYIYYYRRENQWLTTTPNPAILLVNTC